GPQAPQSQAAALGGGADAGLVEQVPGAVGAIRQELGKLPRPAATGLRPALVPTLASPVRPGGSEIVIKRGRPFCPRRSGCVRLAPWAWRGGGLCPGACARSNKDEELRRAGLSGKPRRTVADSHRGRSWEPWALTSPGCRPPRRRGGTPRPACRGS